MSSIGIRIKESREAKGLLQSQLAQMIGVKSAGVISNWEQDVSKPDANKMVRLCEALGISLSYLLDYYGEEKAPLYSSEAKKLAQDYDALDSYGKRVVRLVVDAEKVRCAEQAQSSKVIKIAGRDGRFTEVLLTDDQIKDLQAYIDQLPDPGDDL